MFAHNWPTFEIWRDVWNQWRWLGGGFAAPVRAGIDWRQVASVMWMRGTPRTSRGVILDGLRVMETAALEVIYKDKAAK